MTTTSTAKQYQPARKGGYHKLSVMLEPTLLARLQRRAEFQNMSLSAIGASLLRAALKDEAKYD